ncbi:MAG: hypothetical protein D6756_01045 [Cyanobacteria bacterium J083]|nr:MAG: hypothetical protein D6756_01045 [Cyanobacteria bacterium J083]
MTPPLTGDDLKQLGYKPGPLYREILREILNATLDKKFDPTKAKEEAIALTEAHWSNYKDKK